MNTHSRLPALIAYLIPIFGWLYVIVFQRANSFAMYHARQAIGLLLFILASLLIWAVIAWLLAWIPLLAVLGIALFALVICTWLFAALALVLGMINALKDRQIPLPVFGQWAARLPI